MRWIVFAIVAAVALLFEIAGLSSLGIPGGLLMAGLTLFLVGAGAAIAGHARWAFIAGRKIGAGVAVVGLLGLGVGAATAPPTSPTSASSGVRAAATTVPSAAPSSAARSGAASSSTVPSSSAARPAAATVHAAPSSALAALAVVAVKGRAPRTGYTRGQFGPAWQDVDHNGCDTRNDILARDLTRAVFKAGTHGCVVLSGTLAEPYTGRTISFVRGQGTSEAVQIDHVVALSDAWQTGAQGWAASRRAAFANDPLNLLAVDGPLNMAKGDGDAATWLPPNRGYRCSYVARQEAVKIEYGLWMTPAEKDAIAAILRTCPALPLPGGVLARRPAAGSAPVPAPRPAPAPDPAPAPAPAAGVTYANCAAARAAGVAPLHRGQPGYSTKLDRDGDGVACE
jgi:hypothetical protein